MYQLKSLEDTIVAISTPTGSGGIGIVRLSGRDAVKIADQMFIAKDQTLASAFKSQMVHYGWVVKKGTGHKTQGTREDSEVVDEALLTVFRAPKSYTAEDVVEISCHGGHVSVKTVLSLALDLGARLAEPGEFTKRAFLNGRIDLAQAEAVLDVISAKTDAFLRVSTHQLKGELSTALESIREALMDVYTQIEAVVNFPEDGIDDAIRLQVMDRLKVQKDHLDHLLRTAQNGRILKEGIRVVICGKPNVGKSSLLNVLLKQQRAIVTDIAGTTRDVLEETAQIDGIPFQLVDTAGILEPRDLIEEEAIKRSHLYIESADLILLVLDRSAPLSEQDMILIEKIKNAPVIVVLNKSDLNPAIDERKIATILRGKTIVKVSAVGKVAVDSLESAIVHQVWQGGDFDTHGILVSNIRHVDALKAAQASVGKAMEVIEQNISWEFASEEIKQAVHRLDSITGKNIDADLLDRIFTQFCIGK